MIKKKVLAVILALTTLSTGLFAGCSFDEEEGNWDAKLEVGVYDGGYGHAYLDQIIANFHRDYPNYKIEPHYDKTTYFGTNIPNIAYSGDDDMFLASPSYYDCISQDMYYDLTEIVTTPLNELVSVSDETETIEQKLYDDFEEYWGGYHGKTSKKYYAMPLTSNVWGINYDVGLFDSKSLYKDKNDNWCNLSGDLSLGQDGIAGTYDDGLPVTYQEWTALLRRIKQVGAIPFIWSSMAGYTYRFTTSVFASYEGKENWNTMIDMDGGEYLFGDDTTATAITAENAYLCATMDGKQYALQFIKDIIDGGYYDTSSGKSSMDYLTTQDTYVASIKNAEVNPNTKRVAFIIDGSYWLTECSTTINDVAASNPIKYGNRKFGIMPFPKFENQHATNTTFYADQEFSAFIRSNCKEVELAKLFYAYLFTDESLKLMTMKSGLITPYDFELSPDERSQMPKYYQDTWDISHGANGSRAADLCSFASTNNRLVSDNISFFREKFLWECNKSGVSYMQPLVTFKDTTLSVSVADYLTALSSTYSKSYWDLKFKAYY